VGWTIAAIIFEGAGVIPLILVIVGFLRLMLVSKMSGRTVANISQQSNRLSQQPCHETSNHRNTSSLLTRYRAVIGR